MSQKQPLRLPFKEVQPPYKKNPFVSQIGEFTVKSPNGNLKKFKSREIIDEEQILDFANELSVVKNMAEVKKTLFTK
jgi:hypothetical protein